MKLCALSWAFIESLMMWYFCVFVQAKDLPEVIWKADPKAFYTLVMTGMCIKQINLPPEHRVNPSVG